MKISIIAAITKNRVIGSCGRMPWHLPADLTYFKRLTLNKTIVMGRKTYESIGHPLLQRTNVIISRDPNYHAPGCQVFTSFQEVLDHIELEEIMIIGGGNLYAQALPIATTLYLTLIDLTCEGDTFFPEIDPTKWENVWEEQHEEFKFVRYKRIR